VALTLVAKYTRALAENFNSIYRVLKGTDPDSIDLRLNGGGRFAVHNSGTNAVVFQVTDGGATGTYAPGDIGTADLADGAVTSAKILDRTIATSDIASQAVTSFEIADGTIQTVDIADGAVTSAKILDGAVTSAKIVDGAIVDADVNAAANISGSKLADGTVTSAKILDGTLANADVNAAAGITYGKLALTNSIVNADVNSAAAVAYSKLALTNSIVNADVNSAAGIVVSKLAAGGSANQVVRTTDGTTMTLGQVVSAMIADGTIMDVDINSAANIDGAKLLNNSVPAIKLSGGIPPPVNTVDSSSIIDNSIMNVDINSAAGILGSKLAAGTVTATQLAAGASGLITSSATFGPASTTSTGAVGITGATLNAVPSTGKPHLIIFTLNTFGVTGAATAGSSVSLYKDGAPLGAIIVIATPAGVLVTTSAIVPDTPAVGNHSWGLAWQTTAGCTLQFAAGWISVIELRGG
jgi:hypothetical protein